MHSNDISVLMHIFSCTLFPMMMAQMNPGVYEEIACNNYANLTTSAFRWMYVPIQLVHNAVTVGHNVKGYALLMPLLSVLRL
jgi:hypothetical protein